MKLYCLLDYKSNFVTKYDSDIYRTGMDKNLLKLYFEENDIDLVYVYFSEVQSFDTTFWIGKPVIYTSSEDNDFLYKNYIEDIIYYLDLNGAKIIPGFKYLKANNNKVFMELLMETILPQTRSFLDNQVYGCLEEVLPHLENMEYPKVYKKSAGAMSNGVGLAKNSQELKVALKKISKSGNIVLDFKDRLRSLKHKGYQFESTFRNKFIIQDFIPELNGDFKILIFGNNYYVLKRGVKPKDFRASGSGIRSFEKNLPDGLLVFAKKIFEQLQVPNVSLDIAFDGKSYYLIEFQAVHFGTFTIIRSEFYWTFEKEKFRFVENKTILEEQYALSISQYLCI